MNTETTSAIEPEAAQPISGALRLEVFASETARKYRVRVIGTGFGANFENGRQWYVPDTEDGIGSAKKTFAGARVHWHQVGGKFDHADVPVAQWMNSDHDVGYLSDLSIVEGGLEATLNLHDDVPNEIVDVIASKQVGLSIEAYADRRPGIVNGKKVVQLVNFRHGQDGTPPSVALVTDPALRGEILRVAASRRERAQETGMSEKTTDAPVVPDVSPELAAIKAAKATAEAAVLELKVTAAKATLESALLASQLPEKARNLVRAAVLPIAERGEQVPAEVLSKHIDEARDLLKSDSQVKASGSIEIGATPADKLELSLETLFGRSDPDWVKKNYARRFGNGKSLSQRRIEAGLDGEGREGSFLRLFRHATGHDFTDGLNSKIVASKIRAAINTSQFGDAFENVLNRRMLAYYENPNFQDWRKVCNVSTVPNFVKQERVVLGGYGNLSTVAEGADYQAFTSPGDEGHGYTPAKRGNTETITREAILRDDVGALAAIPRGIGVAAARTLYEFVFDLFTIAGQPTMDYDSTALYHANHSNLSTTALSNTQLIVAIKAMMKQASLTSSKRLMVMPRKILVPIDLANTAFDLLKPLATYPGGSTTDNEWLRSYGMEAIVVRHWTNTTDWFVTCDPTEFPLAEVGFVLGQEEPVIETQDAPNLGSLFDSDTITLKVRHEYGGTVVRHEGAYANDVA